MSKLRSDFPSEYEGLVYCAEQGASDLQLHLAFKMLMTRTDEQRVIEAYQWAFIAHFMNNPRAEDVVTLLQVNMTEDQLSAAQALIEAWIHAKHDEFNRGQNKDWTPELNEFWQTL